MPGFNFEVERERRPKDRGKGWRLLILFLIVALVTGGVIYAIMPERENSETGENGGNAENSEVVAADNAGQSTNTDLTAGDKTGAENSGENKTENNSGNNTGKAAPEDNKKPDTPAVADGEKKPDKNAKYDPSLQELFRATKQFKLDLQTGNWSKSKYALVHAVESNDSVGFLAGKYHNTRLFVQRYNDIADANKIRIGQKIAFIKTDSWQITVSKKHGTLQIDRIVNKNAVPLAVFECRINRAPKKDLVICRRQKKADFRDDHGRIFANGQNPYGEYRIVLADAKSPVSPINYLSIHDCGDPKAAEASLRNGAIVMNNEDIALLYCLIPERTPVRIVE